MGPNFMSSYYEVKMYDSADCARYLPYYVSERWLGMRECKLQPFYSEKIPNMTQLDTNWLFLLRPCALQ